MNTETNISTESVIDGHDPVMETAGEGTEAGGECVGVRLNYSKSIIPNNGLLMVLVEGFDI